MSDIINQQKYLTKSKKVILAYVLWFVVGVIGIHNFYVAKYELASAEAGLFVAAMVLGMLPRGGPGMAVVCWIALICCLVYDLFTLATAVKVYNLRLKSKLKIPL